MQLLVPAATPVLDAGERLRRWVCGVASSEDLAEDRDEQAEGFEELINREARAAPNN